MSTIAQRNVIEDLSSEIENQSSTLKGFKDEIGDITNTSNLHGKRIEQLIDRVEYIKKVIDKRHEEQRLANLTKDLIYNEKTNDLYHKFKKSIILNSILITILVVTIITSLIVTDKFGNAYDDLYDKYIYLNQKFMAMEDTINKMKSSEIIIEEEVPEDKNEIDEEIPPITMREINLTDITKPSNLTADELNSIIDQRLVDINQSVTKLTGIGECLVAMEKESSVNAIFCLAVGSLESGHGTSAAAVNRNNLFGLIGSKGLMTFDSVDECIMYWGRLLRKSYIDTGRDTVESIQKKYCPDSSTWSGNIYTFMEKYSSYIKM